MAAEPTYVCGRCAIEFQNWFRPRCESANHLEANQDLLSDQDADQLINGPSKDDFLLLDKNIQILSFRD